MSAPVETKVTAAGVTAALVVLAMYGLSFVPLVEDMPAPVAGALLVLVTGGVTYGVGWLAPHTPRPPTSLGDLTVDVSVTPESMERARGSEVRRMLGMDRE